MSSHDRGEAFLVEFLEMINNKPLINNKVTKPNINYENLAKEANVHPEFFSGMVTEEEGGRIDILIKLPDINLVIENKLYAGEQPNQLLRYNNFESHKEKILVFLTLDGHEPESDNSEIRSKTPLVCLSYHTDIINWINKVFRKYNLNPWVKYTLDLYKNTLKKLTHQTINDKMAKEIEEQLAKDYQTFENALLVHENFKGAKNLILARFWDEEIKQKLQEEIEDFEFTYNPSGNFNEIKDLPNFALFGNPKDKYYFRIVFESLNGENGGLKIGVFISRVQIKNDFNNIDDNKLNEIKVKIYDDFKELGYELNNNHPWYLKIRPEENNYDFKNHETVKRLLGDLKFRDEVKNTLIESYKKFHNEHIDLINQLHEKLNEFKS